MTHFATLFLLYFLSAFPIAISASETETLNNVQEPEQQVNGQPIVFMDEEMQESIGLQIVKTKTTLINPETIVYGKAINISPLVSIRSDYLSAIVQQNSIKARLAQTKKNISRLRSLHKSEVVSTKKLQKQLSDWHFEKAIYEKNIYQSQSIINNSKLYWGELLTLWATKKNSPQFDKLINGELKLFKITIPPAIHTKPSNIDKIFISSTGTRSTAVEASFICTLPHVDNMSQGVQYMFLGNTTKIKTGTNFTAWLPQQKQNIRGVIIPKSSIAWHLGQSFVFIQIDGEHFVHRHISNPIKTLDGYYVGGQITEGEDLVVTGTSMLLSHEFRSQIPIEADDDDD